MRHPERASAWPSAGGRSPRERRTERTDRLRSSAHGSPPVSAPPYTTLEWVVLVVAALAVGVTKTAMPALGTIPVALFATVLPAKESTGAVLGLLLVGDVVAVAIYHSHADWALRKLIPSVLAGVLLGVVVLWFADDAAVRRVIGGILVFLVLLSTALTLGRRRGGGAAGPPGARTALRAASRRWWPTPPGR